MRLKIIFFPLILTISVVLILMYGYPLFTQIRQTESDIAASRSKLAELQNKSINVGKLQDLIGKGGENVDLVYKYLPQNKQEEVAIDSVNFVAFNTSGLSLNSIEIEKSENGAVSAPASTTTNDQSAAPKKLEDGLKYVSAKVSVTGKYEDIRIFLDRLNVMQNYVRIKEVSIGHPQKDVSANQGNANADQDTLNANVSVDFAYVEKLGLENGPIADVSGKNSFDFSVLDKIKDGSAMKVPDLRVGDAGNKANPFKL